MQEVMPSFDMGVVRAEFPGLAREGHRIFFDNPAGTQIAKRSLDRMVGAMIDTNANLGGFFDTSVVAGELVNDARRTAAAFLNAPSPDEIVFGQSMTSLTFSVARALGATFEKGDAILLTRMEHDANIAPWLTVAKEHDLEVRWLDFDPDGCEFDLTALDRLLEGRLRLAAVTLASNVTGTANDVKTIAGHVRAAGGLTYVDAVQYAPHRAIDVQDLGCDFLACSAYKFFGPHHGVLWGRGDLLDELPSQNVRPAAATGPGKWEQGTKSRESIAGVAGAIEHFAWLGERFGGAEASLPLRERIVAGLAAADAHERNLTAGLISGLQEHPGLRIHGLTATQTLQRRVPTVSFTLDSHAPARIAEALAERRIQVWSGHNYGIEPVRRLGLDLEHGVLRVGLAHYNSREEVGVFLQALRGILAH